MGHQRQLWTTARAPIAQEATLLDAKSRNNMYFIEYTVKKPSQEQKHLLSAVALGFNGRYSMCTQICYCATIKQHVSLYRTYGANQDCHVALLCGSRNVSITSLICAAACDSYLQCICI